MTQFGALQITKKESFPLLAQLVWSPLLDTMDHDTAVSDITH